MTLFFFISSKTALDIVCTKTSLKNLMMDRSLPFLCFFLISAMFAAPSDALSPMDKSKIRGMFVFGSSVVDNGNNNFIPNSLARVDYPPYGIDFPLGPTGRSANGENIADILGKMLDLPNYIPPFNDPSTAGSRIVHGVNYGSAGSGILDETGAVAGNVISLNQQIRNFETTTLPELEMQLGQNSSRILPQYMFLVASGGNDYSLNYLLNLTRSNVTLEAFTANLTSTFTLQLKRLYSLGARKFVLVSINPNGCAPVAMASAAGEGCVERINNAVQMFNIQMRNLTDALRPQLPGSGLVFVNAYKIVRDIIRYPSFKGFRNVDTSCCNVSAIGFLCVRGGPVCSNRREYVYFDGNHVTEAVNRVIATKAFSSNLGAEVYPYNVQKLSQI
ncbi:GDSL esterase/lipase At1g29660-like [Andrographis paniculata]|uniref:GDSL esterase/lipase At1g29660-like n=1 Tax=Andrographis paniculata TaxID=175694 RepID=UPI0021E91311|nr:GDSL esterase/lipase At1g29660-like [Andrographis paniculata]